MTGRTWILRAMVAGITAGMGFLSACNDAPTAPPELTPDQNLIPVIGGRAVPPPVITVMSLEGDTLQDIGYCTSDVRVRIDIRNVDWPYVAVRGVQAYPQIHPPFYLYNPGEGLIMNAGGVWLHHWVDATIPVDPARRLPEPGFYKIRVYGYSSSQGGQFLGAAQSETIHVGPWYWCLS